jgi:V-type H+-transporting ATPase subunit F
VKHVTDAPDSQKNYLVVDAKTEQAAIEEAFDQFTRKRKDIAIVLINQHVCARFLMPGSTCWYDIWHSRTQL